MRKALSNIVAELADSDEKIIFMTGDLGYNAFEELQKKLGNRFINMGVAEQNMVGVAAGMAHKGFKVFCYSIAPFIVYRCLEQFRNDACLHDLPVFLIGNGGGYGYGIMGSSHHALEDIACLSGLQNCHTWIPAFTDDVRPLLYEMVKTLKPSYMRLGIDSVLPATQSKQGSFNLVVESKEPQGTVITLGPIINNALAALSDKELNGKFSLLSVVTLPLHINDFILNKIEVGENVLIIEEHIRQGGIGEQLAGELLRKGVRIKKLFTLNAEGYPGKVYGDQAFHQRMSGLNVENIKNILQQCR